MIALSLLGKNIRHSRSQEVYENFLGQKINYTKYDCETTKEIPSLEEIFRNHIGLSITSPYKEHFLNKVMLEEEVSPLNAINCIKKVGDQFHATNTDYFAVKEILRGLIQSRPRHSIILLGSGAMARVTLAVASVLNVDLTQYSRGMGHNLDDPEEILKHDSNDRPLLFINACSREYVFPLKLRQLDLFWDYNYSHKEHESLLPSTGTYLDGFSLLKKQAEYALTYWGLQKF